MEEDPANQRSDPHILLADGDVDDREFFCSAMFRLYPHVSVTVFTTGQALLDFLKCYEETRLPGCIILEYRLPSASGPEILQAIGFLPRFKDVPTVVWSNLALNAQIDECLTLGASRYVAKPDTFEGVEKFVKDIFLQFLSNGGRPESEESTKVAS